jgi:hypothetical protein
MPRPLNSHGSNNARCMGGMQRFQTLYVPSVNAYQRFERALVGLDEDVLVRGRHGQTKLQERRET